MGTRISRKRREAIRVSRKWEKEITGEKEMRCILQFVVGFFLYFVKTYNYISPIKNCCFQISIKLQILKPCSEYADTTLVLLQLCSQMDTLFPFSLRVNSPTLFTPLKANKGHYWQNKNTIWLWSLTACNKGIAVMECNAILCTKDLQNPLSKAPSRNI